MITLGIIREGKNPPDKRVPLTPAQCRSLLDKYPGLKISVQTSTVRAYKDDEYSALGVEVSADLLHCDLLLGVKEVPVDMLIPGKSYMFFSHTFKKQPYNRKMLRAILEKKISLIDYELLTDEKGVRLLGFGKYAGIVGCYNAFRAYGLRSGRYALKPAHECHDRREVEQELKKVSLPDHFRMVMTGGGRVANGAIEILEHINIDKLNPEAYLKADQPKPAYTQLSVLEYVRRNDGGAFTSREFYENPESFNSNFMPFAAKSDMYVPCHFWDNRAPVIFSREDALRSDFRINLVADISCDVNGPIASTIRTSTIDEPFYGYDPATGLETDFMNPLAIGVMAVDNLPCELPRDASEFFGGELIKNILPEMLEKDRSEVIERARQTDLSGNLTPKFEYLSDYAFGEQV